jgi:hypothetical protein
MSDQGNNKTNMRDLLTAVLAGTIRIADINVRDTDGGKIIDVSLESMEHADVLGIVVSLPGEVENTYLLSDTWEG